MAHVPYHVKKAKHRSTRAYLRRIQLDNAPVKVLDLDIQHDNYDRLVDVSYALASEHVGRWSNGSVILHPALHDAVKTWFEEPAFRDMPFWPFMDRWFRSADTEARVAFAVERRARGEARRSVLTQRALARADAPPPVSEAQHRVDYCTKKLKQAGRKLALAETLVKRWTRLLHAAERRVTIPEKGHAP